MAAGLPNIKGSSVHLNKTTMNLVSNAAEAQPKGGKIIVTTQALYVDRAIRGYDTEKTAQRLGAGEYLKKPYMIDSLGKTVKNALAGIR